MLVCGTGSGVQQSRRLEECPPIPEWNAKRLLQARVKELIKLWPVGSWDSDYKLKNGKDSAGFLGIPFEQLEENKNYKVVVDPEKKGYILRKALNGLTGLKF